MDNTTTLTTLTTLDDIDDIRELTPYEQQLVSGGDFGKGVAVFALAGGIGYATFGAGWGSMAIGAAFALNPIAIGVMVGLAAYGGYQLATD